MHRIREQFRCLAWIVSRNSVAALEETRVPPFARLPSHTQWVLASRRNRGLAIRSPVGISPASIFWLHFYFVFTYRNWRSAVLAGWLTACCKSRFGFWKPARDWQRRTWACAERLQEEAFHICKVTLSLGPSYSLFQFECAAAVESGRNWVSVHKICRNLYWHALI